MKTLVTGGAGFIGSHLVDLLVESGHEVVVLDNFSHGRRENLADARAVGNVVVVEDDIRTVDYSALFEEHKPEVVFSLAAQIDVRKSVADPLADADSNISAIIRMASAAKDSSVRRIVHTSSGGAIYGEPDSFPVSEKAPVDPKSPYAVSKVAGELYLKSFSYLYGLETTFIAPANVYGPRQDPHGEAGVVAIFCQKLLEGAETFAFGKGDNTRDYVYVKDVARAFILAAQLGIDGTRYNIGTGRETSDLDLHRLIAVESEAEAEPTMLPARLGDLPRSSLDSSLAGAELGWKPNYELEQGLAETVSYFRERLG